MQKLPKYPRILAIAPSASGFGFAVVEGIDMLVAWGDKRAKKDKNAVSRARTIEVIERYAPEVIVLEDPFSKGVRRAPRIRSLVKQITALARKDALPSILLPRQKVRQTFFADAEGTKQALAELMAKEFPEELGTRLPPRRKLWKKEDSRMAMFEAVALAVAFRRNHSSKRISSPGAFLKNGNEFKPRFGVRACTGMKSRS